MNAKYLLGLMLTLQVSMSLCDIPPPSQELVEKYDDMKKTFFKRVMNLYSKAQAQAAPMMEQLQTSEKAQEAAQAIQENAHVQALVKVATSIGPEQKEALSAALDKAREKVLGAYEHYLRPYVGTTLAEVIDNIKVILDKYLPAE